MFHSENKVLVVRDGGIELVLAAMAGHSQNAAVQQHACVAFYNIASNNCGMFSNLYKLTRQKPKDIW